MKGFKIYHDLLVRQKGMDVSMGDLEELGPARPVSITGQTTL